MRSQLSSTIRPTRMVPAPVAPIGRPPRVARPARGGLLFVAQSCTLLYRRIAFGRPSPERRLANYHSTYKRNAFGLWPVAGPAGFTLVELMVVIAIIGILTAMMIPEMKGSFEDALLRSTGRELINVFDLANSRAVSLNQTRRVRLDEKSGRYLVEKLVVDNGTEDFVPTDDGAGGKGELDARIAIEIRQPGGPDTESQATAPRTESAITFYPDGTADAGDILLRDRDGFRLLLQINPVTAHVQVVELEREPMP
ncbi:MAG TPA: GspH/FimT family pseudopilin [Verrucomicrobiae bacterium]